jgi:sulfotransferase family protein
MATKRAATDAPVIRPMLTLASLDDAERLVTAVREFMVEVREPLMLVSGLQRSGGTLLNSLLDGHPQLHAYPYELAIGEAKGEGWPALGVPPDISTFLGEDRTGLLFRGGYSKGNVTGMPTLPYLIPPSLVAGLFRTLCADGVERPRDVFDAYFTAFFNAWLDNQGLRAGRKRWVVAMAPRLLWGDSRTRFFEDYPDGRAIVPLRDPVAWYASFSRFKKEFAAVPKATELWLQGTGEALAAKRQSPERVLLVRYETLVSHTKQAVKKIAAWLEIDTDPLLFRPTFNRLPTWANSSFEVTGPGVKREPLDAWTEVVSPVKAKRILEATRELYEEAYAAADVG